MALISRVASAALCMALASAPALALAPVSITRNEIVRGVHQFTVASDGYVERLNVVAVITDAGVVVFDTTTRPSTARTILAEIRKLTDKPVKYVVNSHWHPDHWSGNEVFADAFPAAEFIATEHERELMLTMAPSWAVSLPPLLAAQERAFAEQVASGFAAPGVPLTPERRQSEERELQRSRDMMAELRSLKRVYPTLTYTDRMTLRHGGREFQFISVTGDAAATTVMYLPAERVLMTGDVITWPLPYYTPPPSEHARSIRRLIELDAQVVVPGHGPAFRDARYMALQAELFESIVRQVRDALRAGRVSLDDVQQAIDVRTLGEQFARNHPDSSQSFPAVVRGIVRRAYLELRDGKER